MSDVAEVKEAIDRYERWTEDAPELTALVDAARRWVRMVSESRIVETDDCQDGHRSCSTLEVFDMEPGRYLVVRIDGEETE